MINGSLRAVLFHLSEAKEALQIRPKTQRELRLTEWKRRMNSDLKFVGRWLKSRKSVVGVEMLTRHGEGCDSKQAIADYWEDIGRIFGKRWRTRVRPSRRSLSTFSWILLMVPSVNGKRLQQKSCVVLLLLCVAPQAVMGGVEMNLVVCLYTSLEVVC